MVTTKYIPHPTPEGKCAVCTTNPADDSIDMSDCRHQGYHLAHDEPICNDCLYSLIEGGTRAKLAIDIFKKRGVW